MANNENEFDPASKFDEEALELMREDASKTIDHLIQKHDAQQKKSIQILQINGIVFTIIVAAVAQIGIDPDPFYLLYISPLLFLISGLLATLALQGDTLSAGISMNQVEDNINAELTKSQYLLWYFSEYYGEAIGSLQSSVNIRTRLNHLAVYVFYIGLPLLAVSIVWDIVVQS